MTQIRELTYDGSLTNPMNERTYLLKIILIGFIKYIGFQNIDVKIEVEDEAKMSYVSYSYSTHTLL